MSMTRPSTRQLRLNVFSLQFLPTQTSAPSPSPCVFFQYQILTVLLFEFTLHTFTSPLSHHHSRATPAFNPDGNPTAPEPRIPSIQLHLALFRDQRLYVFTPTDHGANADKKKWFHHILSLMPSSSSNRSLLRYLVFPWYNSHVNWFEILGAWTDRAMIN